MKELLAYCRNKSKVVCYGAGLYGKIVRTFLYENGIEIDCFVVSRIEGRRKWLLEKRILQIDAVIKSEGVPDYGVIVCANDVVAIDMIENLKGMGVDDYFIVSDDLIEQIDNKCEYRYMFDYHGEIKVLLYHRVCELDSDIWKLSVSPDHFRKHIEFLKRDFHVVNFEDDYKENDKRQIAITFDDGYADNYHNALPILEELGVMATIFVCTGNIDTHKEFWWDELERIIMCNANCPTSIDVFGEKLALSTNTEKQNACYYLREKILLMDYKKRELFLSNLREITKDPGIAREVNKSISIDELITMDESSYITIGGHTVTHTRLTSETIDEQKWEISQSKKDLENAVGHDITIFSYPFGGESDYDRETIKAAKAAGYEKMLAVQKRYNEREMDLYNHGRIVIQDDIDIELSMRGLRRAITLG